MRSFAELDDLRAERGLTRKQLYEAAGVHKETWRRTAKGSTSPNSATLKKLSDALDRLTRPNEAAE